MSDKLQYKIINGGLLPPVPSLPQSKTLLIRGVSGQSDNYSDMESVLSVDTSTNIEQENESDSDTSTSSSSCSSDWDARTIISTVSTVLPPRQKTNPNMDIKPYLSQQVLIEFKKDPQIDITYDLYELFYPFTNLQSLLFSQLQPYIETDYKKNKAFENTNNQTNCTPKHNVKMNWDDTISINRIKGLITKLLSSSGSNQGIKEEALYLMFSSPSPNEIIESLRFGSLSNLCDVHMDRFGRRTYHYRRSPATGHKRRQSKLHFYNHSRCPSSMFGDGDIVGLSDFIEEDIKSILSTEHSRNISRSTAKIHYHDNDVVMISSPKNGKMETEVRWQQFAIHSYLYNKTRMSMQSLSESISPKKKRKSLSKKRRQKNAFKNPIFSINTRARAIGQYRPSMIHHMFKPKKSPGLHSNHTTPNIIIRKVKQPQQEQKSVQKRAMTQLDKVTKEGFLEKENIRSIAIIVSKPWIAFWCVLKNKQLLLYKSREIKHKKQKMLQKPVECIDLNNIGVPISTGYDTVNKYFTFRLDVVNSEMYYTFRTRSEYERNGWITEIDSMLDYENNVVHIHDKKSIENGKRNEKTENCLIM